MLKKIILIIITIIITINISFAKKSDFQKIKEKIQNTEFGQIKEKKKWKYKDENWELKIYKWLNWEHAFYLLWYKWNYKKPTHIIVWDTMTGKHTYPTNKWMRKWDKMQNRSIIIYAK